MNRIIKRIISILCVAAVIALAFPSESLAYSSRMDYFDFEQTVIKMDAGTTRELRIDAYKNYTYYLGPHTSAATYMECTGKSGRENVVLHIGPDETVKNVFFYFYVDDESVGVCEVYADIEVYVQKIDPAAAAKVNENKAAQDKLRNYSKNSAEFNALYYYYNYKDLQNAFGMDPDRLYQHYNEFGKNEHRVANRYL